MNDQNTNQNNTTNPGTASAPNPPEPTMPPAIPEVNVSDFYPPDAPAATSRMFVGGRLISTVLGLMLLVGGLTAGIVLVQQPQLLNQKAADVHYTTCSTLTSYYDCTRAACKWTSPDCLNDWRNSNYSSCPGPHCAMYDIIYRCSQIPTEAECNMYPESTQPAGHGYGCTVTKSNAYCTGVTTGDTNFCQNQSESFCTSHSGRCKWIPQRFVSCNGSYVKRDTKWCQNTGTAYCTNP